MCLVRENTTVKKSNPGIHGCRCVILESPAAGSTNTWFTARLLNPPNNKNVDKYMQAKGIKLQASHLVPVDSDFKPIPTDELTNIKATQEEDDEDEEEDDDEDDQDEDDEEEEEEEESEEEEEESEEDEEEEEDAKPISKEQMSSGAGGASKAGVLLSSTGPMSHWVGRRVRITLGKQKGHDAYVTGSGNGWVQLQYYHDDKEAKFINDDTTPMECAKRSEFLPFIPLPPSRPPFLLAFLRRVALRAILPV
jgi:hypothetical protein